MKFLFQAQHSNNTSPSAPVIELLKLRGHNRENYFHVQRTPLKSREILKFHETCHVTGNKSGIFRQIVERLGIFSAIFHAWKIPSTLK